MDDTYAESFMRATVDTQITFGNSLNAQVRVLNIEHSEKGTTFQVKMPSNTYEIHTHLLGNFNVSNILAAIGVLHSQKVDTKVIQKAVGALVGVDGRMQIVPTPLSGTVYVDYAHTEESLKQVLTTLSHLK